MSKPLSKSGLVIPALHTLARAKGHPLAARPLQPPGNGKPKHPMTTEQKVITILADHFGSHENTIHSNTRINADLGMDSLDAIDISESLEDEFDLELYDDIDLIAGKHTVSDLAEFIDAKLK